MERNAKLKIRLISANPEAAQTIQNALSPEFDIHEIQVIGDRNALEAALREQDFNLFISEWNPGWISVPEILEHRTRLFSQCPVLLLAPEQGFEVVREALKQGLDAWSLETNGRYINIVSSVSSIFIKIKKCDDAIQAQSAFLRLFDRVPVGLYRTNQSGVLIDVNRMFIEILGFQEKETALALRVTDLFFDPGEISKYSKLLDAEGQVGGVELRMRRRDGSPVWVNFYSRAIRNRGGEIVFYENCIVDISTRKEAEKQLRLTARVFESTQEAIFVTDVQQRIIMVNPAVMFLTGYSREEIIGAHPRLFQSDKHDEAFFVNIALSIREKGKWQGEIWNRRKDGDVFPTLTSISAIRDEDDSVVNYVTIFSDLTEKKLSEDFFDYLSQYDVLTNLPNRLLFMDRLSQAAKSADRNSTKVVLIYMDIDRFKYINDTYGHIGGDNLLQNIAIRLKEVFRAGDTIARIGSDEFTFLMTDMETKEEAVQIAQTICGKISDLFSKPFFQSRDELFLTACMGISIYPDDADTIQSLLKNAETAMYQAKKSGSGQSRFYALGMSLNSAEMLTMESALRRATQNKDFICNYQPIINAQTGRIVCAESLLRWRHKDLGNVSPAKFIPIAEATGLIVDIGELVITQSISDLVSWDVQSPVSISVAVNLSARQFRDKFLIEKLMNTLKRYNIDPHRVELELTETTLMDNIDRNAEILRELKSLGISISIDDFGTGYSSLAYLRKLPIDKLKIDRSFIMNISEDKDSASIVRSIISLAKSLDLRTVAEGIETKAQFQQLCDLGCDEVQGFLFSRPVASDKLVKLLRENPVFPVTRFFPDRDSHKNK